MSLLQPVKAESLSSQVADTIRAAIFNRELLPGQVIRELALAKSLQVSQATVREALAQLESFGLVVRTPNRSTSVNSLSEAEVRDRLTVRLTLEKLAFEQAMPFLSAEEIESLRKLAERFFASRDGKDWALIVETERAFFHQAWMLSHNAVLCRILDQLTTPLYAIWTERQPATRAAIESLLQALENRDLQAVHATLQPPPLAESASAGEPKS